MVNIDFHFQRCKEITMKVDVNSSVAVVIEQLNEQLNWTKWVTSVHFMQVTINDIFRVPKKLTI